MVLRRALIIEEDPVLQGAMREILAEAGFSTICADDVDDAFVLLDELSATPDVIVLGDARRPVDAGAFAERCAGTRARAAPVVVLVDPSVAGANGTDGPAGHVLRPFSTRRLLAAVQHALRPRDGRTSSRKEETLGFPRVSKRSGW